MPKAKQLVLDLTEKYITAEYHKNIVVDVPIRSLCLKNGFYFGEYYEPFLDTPEHSHPHLEIVTLDFEEPTPIEFTLDSHFKKALVSHSTTIFPAHVPHRAICGKKNSFSILTLELAQIASVTYEDVKEYSIELLPQVAVFDPVIDHIEQLLRLEIKSAKLNNHLYLDSLITALSVHLLRQYTVQKTNIRKNFVGLTYNQIRPAVDYMHEYLEENLSLDTIAKVVGMSRYHFIRCFKQAIGISPYQYLVQQRIERAKRLLQVSQLSLADIAIACGFANQSHFTTCFKQQIKITPRTFAKLHGNNRQKPQ
jgi:AraC family transcriptional regulator